MSHQDDASPEGEDSAQVADSERRGIFDKSFGAYRTVTQDDYRSVLTSGLVVLDANVLLDLYRYHKRTRYELLGVLEQLGERLWVPYHVMAEFWRHRGSILQDPKGVNNTVIELRRHSEKYSNRVRQWINQVRLPEESVNGLVKSLESAFDEVLRRIGELSVDEELTEDTDKDPVIIRLNSILRRSVGKPLQTDVRLRAIDNWPQRVKDKRPPGYLDVDKDDNPAGDYLIWIETLAEAGRRQVDVLFVTGDVKEDWWRKEHGQAKGPRPELYEDMINTAGVRLFMLRPESLLVHASDALSIAVSEESIQDVKKVSVEAHVSRKVAGSQDVLRQAITSLVHAMRTLEMEHPEAPASQLLSGPVDRLYDAQGQPELQPLLKEVWGVLETAKDVRMSDVRGARADSELAALSALNRVRDSAIQTWLEDSADEHMRPHPDRPDRSFNPQLIPPPVVRVGVQPIIWDEGGVGQVEFAATATGGHRYTTTRVSPPLQI